MDKLDFWSIFKRTSRKFIRSLRNFTAFFAETGWGRSIFLRRRNPLAKEQALSSQKYALVLARNYQRWDYNHHRRIQ